MARQVQVGGVDAFCVQSRHEETQEFPFLLGGERIGCRFQFRQIVHGISLQLLLRSIVPKTQAGFNRAQSTPAEQRIGHYRAAVLPRCAFSAAAARPRPGGGSGKREGVSRPGSSGQSFAPLGQAQRGQSKDEQKSEPSLRYGAQTSHHPTSAVSEVPLGKRDLPREPAGIAQVIQKRIAGGGACAKLAGKRRFRRTGDPETAPSWTPSLRFAPREGGHRGNLRCGRAARAAICVAREWPGRQFGSGRRRHLAACRRETRRLRLDSQNGRLDLNGCPQERCARGPAATGRPRGGQGEKKWISRPLSAAPNCYISARSSPVAETLGRGDGGTGRGGEEERGRRGEGEKRRGGEEERGLLLLLRRGGGLCFETAYAVSRFARSSTSMRTRSMRRRVASKTVRRTFRQTSCSPGTGTWPNSLKTKPPMVS